MGSEGWLFVSYKEERQGELGIDPETGWPLPNHALWEIWYILDSDGYQTTTLVRRTDLERGNVGRVAWSGGILLRQPGGVREGGHDNWATYRPIRDHYCNTRLSEVLNDEGEVTAELAEQWVTDVAGLRHWVTIIKVAHPPVSNVFQGDPNTYVAVETSCTRSGETGAIESTDQAYITIEGKRVLKRHTIDYVVIRVPEPPAEMLALLDELNQP